MTLGLSHPGILKMDYLLSGHGLGGRRSKSILTKWK